MHGNVWQWCQDWYEKEYYAGATADDPGGAHGGSDRVGRGGSWRNPVRCCRSADRYGHLPSHGLDDLGFRVSLVLMEERDGRAEAIADD